MPELPEVETVKRGLAPIFEGRRLIKVKVRRADLRFPFPKNFGPRLTERVVVRVWRRAKFLLMGLDNGVTLISHLGMSGRYKIYGKNAPAHEKHDHVIFNTDQGSEVRYNDPRRFGFMDLVNDDDLTKHAMLRSIGPEPLGIDFNSEVILTSLKGRKSPIKSALLDQKVVARLGNIYVSEVLFRAGISPKRIAATISSIKAEELYHAIVDVLNQAIVAGGSSINDHRQPSGELGYFQHSFCVYGREGRACYGCNCDLNETGGVRRIIQSGRSTFYCTKRQR